MCRRVLHAGRELPVTVVLASLLQQAFPEETEKRRREYCAAATGDARADGDDKDMDADWTLPVFVMSSMLPGESIALNIFEPRYRLMFRRCLEGNRRLCMTCALQARRSGAQVPLASVSGLSLVLARFARDFGLRVPLSAEQCRARVQDRAGQHFLPDVMTECTIRECTVQPDGRLSVQCVGVRRVHTTGDSEQDGYRVCVIDREIKDVPTAPATGAGTVAVLPQIQVRASATFRGAYLKPRASGRCLGGAIAHDGRFGVVGHHSACAHSPTVKPAAARTLTRASRAAAEGERRQDHRRHHAQGRVRAAPRARRGPRARRRAWACARPRGRPRAPHVVGGAHAGCARGGESEGARLSPHPSLPPSPLLLAARRRVRRSHAECEGW